MPPSPVSSRAFPIARFAASLGLLASLAASLAAPAAAQSIAFEPSDYGRDRLPVRQTTGDAARFIAANEGGAFEPIAELSPGERMAELARPIGRIDVLLEHTGTGERGASACTGALVGDGLVLTNHHCLPQVGAVRPLEASIVMDYLTLDGTGAERFRLDPVPVEWNVDLDYALARVQGAPSTRYGTVALGAPEAARGASRTVIHHPLGRPKVMSRFRCRVVDTTTPPPGAGVGHRCDTLPGSSGSMVFDGAGRAVALHREGGLAADDPTSFNVATDMAAVLDASERLRAGDLPPTAAAAPTGTATPATPAASDGEPSGRLSTGDMNDILRGN